MKPHKIYILASIMFCALQTISYTRTAMNPHNAALFKAIEEPNATPAVVSKALRYADADATLDGNTVLHRTNNPAIAQLLLNNGAPLEKINDIGDTPLVNAVDNYLLDKTDSVAMIEVLLQNGADTSALYTRIPLYDMLENIISTPEQSPKKMIPKATTLKALFKIHDHLKQTSEEYQVGLTKQATRNLFRGCSRSYCLETVVNALSQNADVNARNKHKNTPLTLAAFWCTMPDIAHPDQPHGYDVIMALLDAKANPDASDKLGHSPLFTAANITLDCQLVDILLSYGATDLPQKSYKYDHIKKQRDKTLQDIQRSRDALSEHCNPTSNNPIQRLLPRKLRNLVYEYWLPSFSAITKPLYRA